MQHVNRRLASSLAAALYLASILITITCVERDVTRTAHSSRLVLVAHRWFESCDVVPYSHAGCFRADSTKQFAYLPCSKGLAKGNMRAFIIEHCQASHAMESMRCNKNSFTKKGPSNSSYEDTSPCVDLSSDVSHQGSLIRSYSIQNHKWLLSGFLRPRKSSRRTSIFGRWGGAECDSRCQVQRDTSNGRTALVVRSCLKTGLVPLREHGNVVRCMICIHGMSTLAWCMGLLFSAYLSHIGVTLRLPPGANWAVSAHRSVHKSLYSLLNCSTTMQQLVLGPLLEEVEFRLLLPHVLRHLWPLAIGRFNSSPPSACLFNPVAEIVIRCTCAILFGIAHHIAPSASQESEYIQCSDRIFGGTEAFAGERQGQKYPIYGKVKLRKRSIQERVIASHHETQGGCVVPERPSANAALTRRSALMRRQESLQANRSIPLIIQSLIWGLGPLLVRVPSKMPSGLPLDQRHMWDPVSHFAAALFLHILSNVQIKVLSEALLKCCNLAMPFRCGKTNMNFKPQ